MAVGARRSVVIVGGGPVGMALAVDLGLRGVDCTVVERYREPQAIPKGQNLTGRTFEHLWSWGVADHVRAARVLPADHPIGGVTAYGSLMGEHWYAAAGLEQLREYYFQANDRLPQYRLEAVLRRRAAALPGVELRFGRRATAVDEDEHGVRVTVTPVDGGGGGAGEAEVLAADVVVGCDGGHSTVRTEAGIGRAESDHDRTMALVVFRSRELHELLRRFPERTTYRVLDPALAGYWQFFGRVDEGDGWFFHAPVPTDLRVDDEAAVRSVLERAVGAPFACELDHVGRWDLRVAVADAYRSPSGRVLIAGDAAHSHPPYGGYGLNSGLEDARNLGWKLAAVLQGWGSDALVASYEAERRPIAVETTRDLIEAPIDADARFLRSHDPATDPDGFAAAWKEQRARRGDRVRQFEPHYDASPVVWGPPGGRTSAHGHHEVTARPGHHLAPQPGVAAALAQGRGFIVLGDPGAFATAAAERGVPLVSTPDAPPAYGADVVLVRPDHYVAWSGSTTDATTQAPALLARALGDPG